jgi:RimJ/RimL family protein N-acetyltransferase
MSTPTKKENIDRRFEVDIRLATIQDGSLLWEWANDSVTRRNSFSNEPITWDVHQSWYATKLASPDCRLWILDFQKKPVGQIRYDRISSDTAQISFSVAPVMRGRGFGTLLLQMTPPLAALELGVKWVRGVALKDNEASKRTFVKASFNVTGQQVFETRECLVFQRRA